MSLRLPTQVLWTLTSVFLLNKQRRLLLFKSPCQTNLPVHSHQAGYSLSSFLPTGHLPKTFPSSVEEEKKFTRSLARYAFHCLFVFFFMENEIILLSKVNFWSLRMIIKISSQLKSSKMHDECYQKRQSPAVLISTIIYKGLLVVYCASTLGDVT